MTDTNVTSYAVEVIREPTPSTTARATSIKLEVIRRASGVAGVGAAAGTSVATGFLVPNVRQPVVCIITS